LKKEEEEEKSRNTKTDVVSWGEKNPGMQTRSRSISLGFLFGDGSHAPSRLSLAVAARLGQKKGE
jgi:hypothetical protein